MNLFLARHGNTFLPNTPARWIGSKQDYPLTPEGIQQAHGVAKALKKNPFSLARIYSSSLQRSAHFGDFIAQGLPFYPPITIDSRLNEIDYGLWSDLTQEEICLKWGKEAFQAWNQKSIWPKNANWSPSEDTIKAQIHAFMQELTVLYQNNETLLVISSNGILRYFLSDILQKPPSLKMKTGFLSLLSYKNTCWNLIFWDQDPQQKLWLETHV